MFFDEHGAANLIRSISERSQIFDNGIRRGKARRSLHSVCQLRQDFSPDGSVKELALDCPGAFALLHIHTQSFVGQNSAESANTYLGYAFDELGPVPAGEVTPDASRLGFGDRIAVTQSRLVSDALARQENCPNTALSLISQEEAQAIPYQILLYAEWLRVNLAGAQVATMKLMRKVHFADFGFHAELVPN